MKPSYGTRITVYPCLACGTPRTPGCDCRECDRRRKRREPAPVVAAVVDRNPDRDVMNHDQLRALVRSSRN